LRAGGHQAEFFEASILSPHDLIRRLLDFRPEMCFNIAEGHHGDSRESQIPAVLEMLRLPYTGSGLFALTLALDKPMTKRVLCYHELPTPEFQVFGYADEEINEDLVDGDGLRFPLFLKPSREGTGMGITGNNIVETVSDLRIAEHRLLATYNEPVLCERFVQGRELTLGLVGNLKPTAARALNDRTAPEILPPEITFFPSMEIDTDQYDPSEGGVYTNKMKVELVHDFHYTCPADTSPDLEERLRRLTAAMYRITGGRDVARVDFRIDERDGSPYILEINPLPGLNPEYSDLCIEARAAGWSYERLINTIISNAAERYELPG
ncbi:MAG: hypothetical protein KAU31_13585, partial [Spirochaetaceae bacterium]|nr:hypothetical protein [Spirochaetaceae bacterium]